MKTIIEWIIVIFGLGADREISPVDPHGPRREPIFDDVDGWLRQTERFFDE